MSLSSLFNLPSAPAQILSENAAAAQNTTHAPAPQGDAFASYMAQQMSSGQFSNWQNLTSALANQNALGTSNLATNQNTSDPSSGFGPSPSQTAQHIQSAHSQSASQNSTDTTSANNSNSASSSTSQASAYATHRKFSHLNKDQTLLGDSIDSADQGSGDSSGPTNSTTSSAVSTNAWLMSASFARESTKSSELSGDAKSGANHSKGGTGANTLGALPIVLPSIGAALQAQQNAIKAKGDKSASGNTKNDLKTTSLSDSIQLITPNQTDTNPQSLVSFARGMGLNDSQIHQLFGADAAKASANTSGSATNGASTAAIIGSGASTSSAHSSLDTGSSINTNTSNNNLTLSTATDANALNSGNGALSDLSSGVLSPTATSVLSQVSNLQVQIDQAPGAVGIQNEATATTLADLNSKVGQAGIAGLNGPMNKGAPASTLEVLSVMDANLRPEDVAALQAHFEGTGKSSGALGSDSESKGFSIDMNTALTSMGSDSGLSALNGASGGGGQSGAGANSGSESGAGSNGDANSQGNNANVPSDMAGAYEKLSNKFANEVSTRLQQQFAQGQWKMKFALRPTSLGVVDIQLEMKDGKLAANFQSNNALTQNLIQTNSHHLRNALQGSGISQSSVQVGSGQTNGQGSGSGQNSGVPYTYQSNPLNTQATATEEIPAADDSTITKSSNSDSQLDIFA